MLPRNACRRIEASDSSIRQLRRTVGHASLSVCRPVRTPYTAELRSCSGAPRAPLGGPAEFTVGSSTRTLTAGFTLRALRRSFNGQRGQRTRSTPAYDTPLASLRIQRTRAKWPPVRSTIARAPFVRSSAKATEAEAAAGRRIVQATASQTEFEGDREEPASLRRKGTIR